MRARERWASVSRGVAVAWRVLRADSRLNATKQRFDCRLKLNFESCCVILGNFSCVTLRRVALLRESFGLRAVQPVQILQRAACAVLNKRPFFALFCCVAQRSLVCLLTERLSESPAIALLEICLCIILNSVIVYGKPD